MESKKQMNTHEGLIEVKIKEKFEQLLKKDDLSDYRRIKTKLKNAGKSSKYVIIPKEIWENMEGDEVEFLVKDPVRTKVKQDLYRSLESGVSGI